MALLLLLTHCTITVIDTLHCSVSPFTILDTLSLPNYVASIKASGQALLLAVSSREDSRPEPQVSGQC